MVRSGHANELHNYDMNTKFQEQIIGATHGPVPFNHLAYETLFFAPLSFFPYKAAYGIFLTVNLILLGWSAQLLLPFTRRLAELWGGLPYGVFVCFLPVGITLFQGQDSILLLFLFAAAYQAMSNDKAYQAGIYLGLSLFKFQYCIPVAVLLLAWKNWRTVTAFMGTAAAVVAISVGLTGLRAWSAYSSYLLSVSSRLGSGEQLKYAIYPAAMPNLFGVVFAGAGNQTVMVGLISLAVMMWAAFGKASFPVAVAVAMLVSYHGLIHDATILILPVLLLADHALTQHQGFWKRIWPSVAVLVYPAFAVSAMLPYCLLAVPTAGFLRFLSEDVEITKIE
jgi:hypothetical protein